MSTGGKIILGIATLLPIVFGVLFFVNYISMVIEMATSANMNGGGLDANHFISFMLSHLAIYFVLAMSTHLALMIYYIVHVARHNPRSEAEKIMWILLFIFIGTIPFIIYFFLKVVADKREEENTSGQWVH